MEVERAQRRLESKQREIDAGNNRHLSRDALEVDRADRLARRQARAAAAPTVRRPAAPRQRVRDDDDEDDEDDGEEEDDSFIVTDDDEEEDNDGASDDEEDEEDDDAEKEKTPARPAKVRCPKSVRLLLLRPAILTFFFSAFWHARIRCASDKAHPACEQWRRR